MITSLQNQKIKDIVALETKSRERRERGLFVVEGVREVERALACGYEAVETFRRGTDVSDAVYEKIAYRGSTEGVIAVMKARTLSLNLVRTSENPLVLVLESVEKPGNLGAVLRTADAAGIDAVLICDPLTDIYNPNIIRASLGAVFSVPVAVCTSLEAYGWLKAKGLNILTAQLQDSEPYYATDMRCGTAIVFGTEDQGLSPFWRERSDKKIRIPMAGLMDSLNVSVSAAILCFEAVRQRCSK